MGANVAKQFGEMIGDMAHDMHVAGWYAPAMNIHRGAFSGRTFEYFSEDSLLSGVMASNEIAGAKEKGVYSFMKHFALNDQETNRTNMVCTWADEQAIREIYLKPFEMSVKEGGAQAMMSSFNYIGYTYAGASNNLLNTVLRDEWGFKGFVLTDYFGGYGYQNGDQEIRNGNDSMLAATKITNHITDKSATSVKAMRTTTSCTPPLTVGSTRTVSLRLIPRSGTARYTYGRESPTNTPPETSRTTPSAASPSTSSKSSVPYSDCSGAPAAPLRSMTSDISVIRSYTFHIVYERIQVRPFAVIWGR